VTLVQDKPVNSIRCSARSVTAGYALLLLFTTGVAIAGDDSYGSIKGMVTNAVTGERLRKAYVRLSPASDAANVRPVVTDGDGRFVFENVLPGNYSLEAERQGFIDSKYGEDAGVPVELRLVAGQDLSDLNIKLMPPATVSGHVRDEDGDLWTHARVSIFRAVWEGGKRHLQGFDSAEVNDAGEFFAGHLPPGRYYLLAEPDDFREKRNRVASAPQLQPTWYPSSLDSASATPVVLLPGQEVTGAEIRLRRGSVYRIRGKVSGLQGVPVLPGPKPFMTPRLQVSSTPEEGGNSKGGFQLKQDGSFEVEGVAPGTWQIRVVQGLRPLMVLGVATVQIEDHDVEGVLLAVQAPHALKGVVRMEQEDEPLPAGLSLWLDSSTLLSGEELTTPGKDGRFGFENVPSGRCRVNARVGGSGRYCVKLLRYGGIESSDMTFSVSADGDALEVVLSARGPLVGGVVKRNGAVGSAAPQVVMLPDTSGAETQLYDTHLGTVDQSGAFAVKEPFRPGEYTLFAFESVPDGAWTEAEFVKEIEGKGVRIKVEEGDAKTVEVPLISRSDIAALLTRLGMN
jgi:hypothetical protein